MDSFVIFDSYPIFLFITSPSCVDLVKDNGRKLKRKNTFYIADMNLQDSA